MFKISICQLVTMWWVYTNSIYFDKLLCDWRLTALHLTTNENDERIPPELENGWWWTLKYMRRERLHWETPWQVTCRDQTQIFQFVSDENIDYICLPQDSCNCEVRCETRDIKVITVRLKLTLQYFVCFELLNQLSRKWLLYWN